MTYIHGTFAILQIEGGECQLDFLSFWNDYRDYASPGIFAVVAGEVGRLDNTISG
jgi:hypothetical protein